MVPDRPILMKPMFRSYIWGGQRLAQLLGKEVPSSGNWAESWDIVDRGSDQSLVLNGPWEGWSLRQLIESFPDEILGVGRSSDPFPLLLKYLDCNRDLSLQVHPDDDYAQGMVPPDLGKTEAWYILHADPGAKIYAGLKPGVTREQLEQLAKSGTTVDAMHIVEPKVDECYFIPAGTVHALGQGLVVAEIQQSSDVTFRLFDWNRVDQDGKPRPLHLAQAMDVIDFQRGPISVCEPKSSDHSGWETLVASPQFELHRLRGRERAEYQATGRFQIMTVTRGEACFEFDTGETLKVGLGASVLLPAAMASSDLRLSHDCNALLARLP